MAHIVLESKGKTSLLVKYPEKYLLVMVDKQLSQINEERLLAGCSDAVLAEMKLKYQAIPLKDLRGVAVGGTYAGDSLTLYTKSSKLKYVLSDDYTQEELDALFAGIQRFQPPQQTQGKAKGSDWRTAAQTEEMWKMLGPVGTALNMVGGASLILMLFMDAAWGLLVAVAAVGLYLKFPQYFTILSSKYRKHIKARVHDLSLAMMAPVLAVLLSLKFKVINWPLLVAEVAVLTAVLMVLFYRFSREVRESTDAVVIAMVISVLLSWGLLVQGNHVLNFDLPEPEPYTLMEKDTEQSSKGGRRYYYIIQTEGGETLKLRIAGRCYDAWDIGDQVPAVIDTGAFGIRYAYIPEIE